MKHHFIIITCFFLMFLTACNQECRKVNERHSNQKEKLVYTYPECDDTSYYKKEVYHENGQLSSKGFYKNGQQSGEFKRWTEEGILIESWEMNNGKEHGFVQCWYSDGIKKREAMLNKGIEDGIWKDWDESGKLIREGKYKDGLKHGKWIYHEDNGTKKVRTYENDTLSGYTFEYLVDTAKTIQVVGQYKKGLETGLWKWFDKDSILFETAVFTDGDYTGEYIEYYKNGTIKSKGTLVENNYVGEIIYYDSLGNITDTKFHEREN